MENGLTLTSRYIIYWLPDHKGITGDKIADQIAKSAAHLASEPVQEAQKSLKTIYNEISETAGCRNEMEWNALETYKITNFKCNSN